MVEDVTIATIALSVTTLGTVIALWECVRHYKRWNRAREQDPLGRTASKLSPQSLPLGRRGQVLKILKWKLIKPACTLRLVPHNTAARAVNTGGVAREFPCDVPGRLCSCLFCGPDFEYCPLQMLSFKPTNRAFSESSTIQPAAGL